MGQVVRTEPLWRPQLPRIGDSLELGFHDLIELQFVLAFLRHRVGLNVIRRCLENARKIIGEERLLSTHQFRTDGKSVFLESLREAEGMETRGTQFGHRSEDRSNGLPAEWSSRPSVTST